MNAPRPLVASHVMHRDPGAALPVAVRGEGIHIIDGEGRRYIDASGGAAVSCLGHDDPEVKAAIAAQLERLPFAHTAFFTTQAMEDLAETMVAHAPSGMKADGPARIYFVSGGSEAVESAVKMARQYFVRRGEPGRHLYISRRLGYHGNTLGALAVGGHPARRLGYEELMMPVRNIAPCYAYRDREPGESERAYGRRVADELEAAILDLGPERVCAFIAETVVGATTGAVPAVPGYFKRVREICDRYGVLLILDEVMCGMGRTGTLHACEKDGISPDLMTVAKGMGAGFQPIGAVYVSGRVAALFSETTGGFLNGHTYMGHPMACAGALAVHRAITGRGLLTNVRRQGRHLHQALLDHFGDHPFVGDIRGRGLFRAIELVADRETKEPFDRGLRIAALIKRHAMNHGLICYPGQGGADGVRGDHVLLAPPYIVTADQVGEIVERLGRAVDDALRDAGVGRKGKGGGRARRRRKAA